MNRSGLVTETTGELIRTLGREVGKGPRALSMVRQSGASPHWVDNEV
ncbi:hypothetical protein ACWDT6_25930 [Nocardia grenadensis]|nr:hypothetical protein [Nocardia grenadensis]